MQTSFDQAIDFVKKGQSITIRQDGQSAATLFSFKEGSELLRARHAARLDDYSAAQSENVPQDELGLSMDNINKLVNLLGL